MNSIMLILAALSATLPGQDPVRDRFPSDKMVHIALRGINDEFLKAEPGKDCWMGFVPLIGLVEKYRETGSVEDVHKVESEIVSRFTLYSFACEYDKDMVKADFSTRLECIRGISKFELVRSDTNTLFRMADWLSRAVLLDVDDKSFFKEGEEAFRRDMLMVYGGKAPPRYPGSVGNASHYGPAMRECSAKFQFRRLYNTRLPKFREEASVYLRKAVMEGYKDLSSLEREEIWANFCRRAQTKVPCAGAGGRKGDCCPPTERNNDRENHR